ncbi:hypothetical protein LTR08_003775 [Meristemomyces frigidus]|nr:hypothetical protein LTR08_003775 [Meristemomyces frigidus]
MLLPFLPAALITAATARSLALPPILLQEPLHNADHHMPTIHESTIMARRIVQLAKSGTLVTTFPDTSPSHPQSHDTDTEPDHQLTAYENRPAGVAGSPIGMMEYYADCEATGNPTLLAIDIATPYKNAAAGSNVSMHIRWWPTQTSTYTQQQDDDEDPDIPTPHTPAALPRLSLHGHLSPLPLPFLAAHSIPACFLDAHPDSALWQPGNDIHTSAYVRFEVEHIYWFGGFGDRAQIGWLPVDEWSAVTREEIEAMRLPGE